MDEAESRAEKQFSDFCSSPQFRSKYLEALEVLSEKLFQTWSVVLPVDSLWPNQDARAFFEHFVQFGIRVYDLCARTILRSNMSTEEYLRALNFDLKTLVYYRICPFREPLRTVQDQFEASKRGERLDEWALRMGEAWRLFDHPRHAANYDRVRGEFIDPHGFCPGLWTQLNDSIHKAVSRRSIHWLAEHATHFAEVADEAPSSSTAAGTAGPGGRANDNPSSAPTFPPKKAIEWEEIELTFLGDHGAGIQVAGSLSAPVNYKEIAGFEDRRTGRPNKCWAMLRVFATLTDGTMPDDARTGKEWVAIKKTVERCSKILRKHFDMTGDPLPYIPGTGYRARIKLRLAPDSPQ